MYRPEYNINLFSIVRRVKLYDRGYINVMYPHYIYTKASKDVVYLLKNNIEDVLYCVYLASYDELKKEYGENNVYKLVRYFKKTKKTYYYYKIMIDYLNEKYRLRQVDINYINFEKIHRIADAKGIYLKQETSIYEVDKIKADKESASIIYYEFDVEKYIRDHLNES